MTPIPTTRGRLGALMTILAAAATAIAASLVIQHLSGTIPPCGPVRGCETVLTSPYAQFAGIPVALPGALVSFVTLAGAATWWWRGDRRGLLVAYIAGLASLLPLAYLTYLELFVIHALCAWCVTYAATVVGGWLAAVVAYRSTPA
jgi:uncharacterized membrane protein